MYGRQAGSNQGQQMLRRHGNLTPYARLLQRSVCWAETLHAPGSIINHYHPGCLRSHQSNQPRSSVIKRIHYASTQVLSLNNLQQYTASCKEAVGLNRSHYLSSQAAAGVNLLGEERFCFDGFSICVYENIQAFWKRVLLVQRKWRWNEKCLQCKNNMWRRQYQWLRLRWV